MNLKASDTTVTIVDFINTKHQHHQKRATNALHYGIVTVMTSLGHRNFSAHCNYGTTVVYAVHHWLKCHYTACDCTLFYTFVLH